MNVFYAVLLGLIQGLTEFLPISSTAHLTLAGVALHLIDPLHPELWTEYIAVIQLGTLAAVVVYFWRDIVAMIVSPINDAASGALMRGISSWNPNTRMAFFIAVGTLPVVIIGLSFRHVIEGALTKSITVIASSLVVLALLLWVAERIARHVRTIEQVTWVDALVIGFAQACALIPGSSRSGTTITAGLFLGFGREAAARFSFLLSIPAVFASGIYELTKIHAGVFTLGLGNLAIATIVSGITGYIAIGWLLRYLMKNTTMLFVGYRIALGVLLFALLAAGLITG
ncbi:MAG: undecaprenyl-diphosphatase UppP [Bacteroidota bacterium]